jgi:hypothetical protein
MAKRTTPWTDQKMNPIDVQERINGYVDMVQRKINSYWNLNGFTHSKPPMVELSFGKRYCRVIKADDAPHGQRMVHSFIDMGCGDILKAGGWKAPQPNGVRGNIFEDDMGASVVNEHGTNYV